MTSRSSYTRYRTPSLRFAVRSQLWLTCLYIAGCTSPNPDFNPRLFGESELSSGSEVSAGAEAGQGSGGVSSPEAGSAGGESGAEAGGVAGVMGGEERCVEGPDADCDGDGVTPADGDCDDLDPSRYPGAMERCDGVDHNCDGVVGGEIQNCYSGPIETQAVGRCESGIQRCEGDQWGACEGEVTPVDERCDGEGQGVDDNCDGQVDEGCDLDGDGVSPAEGDCDDEDPNIFPGAPDLCDGINSDCDEEVDEDLEPCYDGDPDTLNVGVCASGRLSCIGGQDGSCQGQTLPSTERCGGGMLDENCNGLVDEGCETATCEDLDLSVPLHLTSSCMMADSSQQTIIRLNPTTLSGGPLPSDVTFSLTAGINADITGPLLVNGEWVWILKAPVADVDFYVSANAHCGAGAALAYENQALIQVRYPIISTQGLEFGACRASAGNLLVTVIDAETGNRISGASVMIGDAPRSDWQIDPYAWLRGEQGQAPNTATTNLAGQAKLIEYGGALSAPFNLTVTAPGYEYVTIMNMNSPQVTLQLKRSEYPQAPYFATGNVQDFNNLNNDGDTDIALVMPSITLRELSTLNTSKLLSRRQCWTPLSLLPAVELPGNLYVPSQREAGDSFPYLIPFTINEHRYRVSDRARSVDNLVALGGKISTQRALDALEDPNTTMADLLAEVTFGELGIRRNQSFSTNNTSNRINIPLSTGLNSTATCSVSSVPTDAYVTCLSAGAWPDETPNNEDARLFPMGIVNIPSSELTGGATVSRSLTVAEATGDLNGVIYLGATVALFDEEHPLYADAVSAVIKRNTLSGQGGVLSVSDFFNPLALSRDGRTYSWSPAQSEGSPIPHLCELELRGINRIDYNPGGCSDIKSREESKPLWRVFMVQDPQSVTLPEPPTSWPRGAAGGLLAPSELSATERMQAQIRCLRLFYNSDDLNFENRSWSSLPLSHVTFNTLDLSAP